MIRVAGLSKRFGSVEILKNISFDVAPQTVLGIFGSSGSGKTTLLRCLNGFERINSGLIECGKLRLESSLSSSEYKQRVRALRREVGTVFQHFYLFPHLTVLANITEAPVHVLHRPKKNAELEAYQLLDSVGLKEKAGRYPESLSGGEQQRVAIARALAMRPTVVLFDEPTSALDPRRMASLRSLFRSFAERGHTLIIISHSIGFLHGVSDFLLYMDAGEVIEYGTAAEVVNAPKDPRTRDFLAQAE